MSSIELDISGKPGTIELSAFEDALRLFGRLVRELGDDSGAPLPVSQLEVGSLKATIEAPNLAATRLVDGIEYLRSGQGRPSDWSNTALRSLKALGEIPGKRGATGLSLVMPAGATAVDPELVDAIECILEAATLSIGTIAGRLCSYSSARLPVTARIKTPDSPSSIEVIVKGDELRRSVASLVEQDVVARGLIETDPFSGEKQRMRLRAIEVAEPISSELAHPDVQGRGLWRDVNSGVDSVEWVRRLRSE